MINENEKAKPVSTVRMVSKLGLKCVVVSVIAVLLLIPTCSVQSLIKEREATANEVTREVSEQWSGELTVIAPCLSVVKSFTIGDDDVEQPADDIVVDPADDEKKCKKTSVVKKMNVLPHALSISGDVKTSLLKRSIYQVVTFNAPLTITGDFKLNEEEVNSLKYFEGGVADIDFAVSNLKGIVDEVVLQFGSQRLVLTPNGLGLDDNCKKMSAKVDISELLLGNTVPFSMTITLKGSKSLNFIPVAQNTSVNLKSDWHSPSFNGSFLPDNREVGKDGFSSSWKVSYLNRSYPQLFIPTKKIQCEVANSAFGVDFILPVQHYQQCMRTAKYAFLFIFLTFAIFFFIEVLNKKSIHPIQYLFVGLALCVFYCLLLSLSEHVGFVWAYALSTLMTIVMITLYAIAILRIKKTACYIGAALGGLYAYIFVLIQMETYALLAGSLGLFAILGLLMYFSQRINWNNAD